MKTYTINRYGEFGKQSARYTIQAESADDALRLAVETTDPELGGELVAWRPVEEGKPLTGRRAISTPDGSLTGQRRWHWRHDDVMERSAGTKTLAAMRKAGPVSVRVAF